MNRFDLFCEEMQRIHQMLVGADEPAERVCMLATCEDERLVQGLIVGVASAVPTARLHYLVMILVHFAESHPRLLAEKAREVAADHMDMIPSVVMERKKS